MIETQLEYIYDGITHRTREHGHFFCLSCKANLTPIIMSFPNDMQYHPFTCPRCGKHLVADPGLMALELLRTGLDPKTKTTGGSEHG